MGVGEDPSGTELKPLNESANQDNNDTHAADNYEEDNESNEDEETKGGGGERAAWGGQMEFLFTCIGYAVGLGNVWRFPYLCYKNGGGAFLVPYIIMLGIVGLPLFFLELILGQFPSLGPITVWKLNPLFKGLGYAMVSVSWLIAVYYNVIISHVMLYLFASFASITRILPWITCDNVWNTDRCIGPRSTDCDFSDNSTSVNCTAIINGVINATLNATSSNFTHEQGQTAAEEYYKYYVLEQTDGIGNSGGVNWKLALCLLLSWLVVLICLIRGIQSLGKVVYFTAIFPYVMLTILLIRGATLDGAIDGVIFYLKPDFARLADPRVWSDAATQIFYSLSACSGGLIAMASYNKFDNNCYRDSLIVAMINCATSIYAGFVIFCILGFMANEKGVSVADVAAGGPGLAFVVYPEAIAKMPVPVLWAIFFFFMMATLGFGSQFSIVECVLSAFTDEFSYILRGRKASITFRVCVIFFTFLMGLPMVTRGGIYLLDLVDYSVSGFPLLFVGLLELIALSWIYGWNNLSLDIECMLGFRVNKYWMVCWRFVSPIVILITIVFNCIFYKNPKLGDYEYPPWAVSLGWCVGMFPIMLIVFFFLWRFCKDGGFLLIREMMRPKEDWGPADQDNMTRRIQMEQPESPTPVPDITFNLKRQPHKRIILAATPCPSYSNLYQRSLQADGLHPSGSASRLDVLPERIAILMGRERRNTYDSQNEQNGDNISQRSESMVNVHVDGADGAKVSPEKKKPVGLKIKISKSKDDVSHV